MAYSLADDEFKGMGRKDDRFVMILAVDKVFSVADLESTYATEDGEKMLPAADR
jgi:hypothetical protein